MLIRNLIEAVHLLGNGDDQEEDPFLIQEQDLS
jgi:hypothetical protein